nr:MupG family TIM beta-alpha barrel fold protein [Spiroplasma sp. ChiS]
MAELGISLYTDKATAKECKEYLVLAKKYYFTKLFVNYIGIEKNQMKCKKSLKKF